MPEYLKSQLTMALKGLLAGEVRRLKGSLRAE